MIDSIMLEKAKDFAVETVNVCKKIRKEKGEKIMTYQLIRSGTSVGANIHESKYAQSTADFINKMQIALKECYEAEYWLEILCRTSYLDEANYKKLLTTCGQLRRMLSSSVRTTKEKIQK